MTLMYPALPAFPQIALALLGRPDPAAADLAGLVMLALLPPLLLFLIAGVGFALYDVAMGVLGRSLSRPMALTQATVMTGHVTLGFWGTVLSEGSDQLLLFSYTVFCCLILVHALGEARAAEQFARAAEKSARA